MLDIDNFIVNISHPIVKTRDENNFKLGILKGNVR